MAVSSGCALRHTDAGDPESDKLALLRCQTLASQLLQGMGPSSPVGHEAEHHPRPI